MAPTGRSGTTIGTFVTHFTELNLHKKHHSYILFLDDGHCWNLHHSFADILLQNEHELQHKNLQVIFTVSILLVTNKQFLSPADTANTFKLSNLLVTCT